MVTWLVLVPGRVVGLCAAAASPEPLQAACRNGAVVVRGKPQIKRHQLDVAEWCANSVKAIMISLREVGCKNCAAQVNIASGKKERDMWEKSTAV